MPSTSSARWREISIAYNGCALTKLHMASLPKQALETAFPWSIGELKSGLPAPSLLFGSDFILQFEGARAERNMLSQGIPLRCTSPDLAHSCHSRHPTGADAIEG
jgi:hypothetical protein